VNGGWLVGVLIAAAVLLATTGPPGRRARLKLPRRRRPEPAPTRAGVPFVCDLLAAATLAGATPAAALNAVLDALVHAGLAEEPELRRAATRWAFGGDAEQVLAELAEVDAGRWRSLADPLLLSVRTGAPVAELLSSAASSARSRRRWDAEAAAAALSASLVLPLGLCTLPAFLLLGVVPVVISLARGVLG